MVAPAVPAAGRTVRLFRRPAQVLLSVLITSPIPRRPQQRRGGGRHPFRSPAELQAITDALARFEPDYVGVEWSASDADTDYARYRAGTLPPSRNEVVQLGFRLAAQRKLERVHGLDVPGDFPFERVQPGPGARPRAELATLMKQAIAFTGRITAQQRDSSIGQVLRSMNQPGEIAAGQASTRNCCASATAMTNLASLSMPRAKATSPSARPATEPIARPACGGVLRPGPRVLAAALHRRGAWRAMVEANDYLRHPARRALSTGFDSRHRDGGDQEHPQQGAEAFAN